MAAGDKDEPNQQLCKKCKLKVASGLKCFLCASYFHPSCARKCSDVKIIGATLICCEKPVESTILTNDKFEEALNHEELPTLFKYILKQKDIIISELQEKVVILKKQIEMQKQMNTLKSIDLQADSDNRLCEKNNQQDKRSSSKKEYESINENKQRSADMKTSKLKLKQPSAEPGTSKSTPYAKHNQQHQSEQSELSQEVTSGLIEIQPTQPINTNESTTWTKVTQKQKRFTRTSHIIGNNTQPCSIKVAPKKGFIYVSRLAPETTTSDLAALLTPNFPEATIQKLDCKHPEFYSAFKVTVHLHNFDSAMHPENWPKGCYVTRYFHRGRQTKSPS